LRLDPRGLELDPRGLELDPRGLEADPRWYFVIPKHSTHIFSSGDQELIRAA